MSHPEGSAYCRQHFLNFFPLPHGHGSFRPTPLNRSAEGWRADAEPAPPGLTLCRSRSAMPASGEVFVVPRGMEHRPVARDEVHLLLIEPTGTPNTGDASTAAPRRTV